MIKLLLLFLGMFVASETLRSNQLPEWSIQLNEKADSIPQGRSILKISVYPENASVVVRNAVSGVQMKDNLSFKSSNGNFIYDLDSGEYVVFVSANGFVSLNRVVSLKSEYYFEAYANLYNEIEEERVPEVNLKPVVYMYPTEIANISLSIEPMGEFTYTYPLYDEKWQVKAYPDGKLESNGRYYDYLFWEGTQNGYKIDSEIGDCVAASETIEYLDKHLDRYGLNFREKQDFITFWAPKLIENPYFYVVFLPGEMYDKSIATHEVDYSFDTTIKLHMLYQGMDYKIESHGQKAVSVKRTGSVYVEWGGAEYNALINHKL